MAGSWPGHNLPGEPEEYITFVTPECWGQLLLYMKVRENIGEKIAPSSAVFVWDLGRKSFAPDKVRPVNARALKNQLAELMKHSGIRSVLTEGEVHKTYDAKQAHGYRKFFKTTMEMSGAKPIITEMLMGHALGVAGSYMKPTQEEMLGEYAKAIDKLTIIEKRPEKAEA